MPIITYLWFWYATALLAYHYFPTCFDLRS